MNIEEVEPDSIEDGAPNSKATVPVFKIYII